MKDYIFQSIANSIAVKNKILHDDILLTQLERCAQIIIQAFNQGKRVILAGNGGSAADAQHIAAEFVSRFEFDRPGLPSIALSTDTSMLTAIGNDYGFENLFKRQLQANGQKGDIFIGISTSGNSANILKAFDICEEKGIFSVGLAGESGKIQQKCDICLSVPSSNTARIQECHILIGHIICGLVEESIFSEYKK